MKKTMGIVATCALVFLMAGCGKTDKLTCTLEDSYLDDVKMTAEIEFDGDKVKAAKSILEFADKDTATAYKSLVSLSGEVEVKQDGKKLYLEATKDELAEMEDYKNKAEVKKYLEEEEGYTCK